MAAKILTLSRDECDKLFAPALGTFFMSTLSFSTHYHDRQPPEHLATNLERKYRGSANQFMLDFIQRYDSSLDRVPDEDAEPIELDEDTSTATPTDESTPRFMHRIPRHDEPQSSARTEVRLPLERSLEYSAIACLGTTCFGYIFERYKKILTNADKEWKEIDLDPAFGLAEYSDRATFEKRFSIPPNAPGTIWLGPPPNDHFWLSRMIRNAFAHAQWEFVNLGSGREDFPQKVRLWNDNANKRTFQVEIGHFQVRWLIYEALANFIEYVQVDKKAFPPKRLGEDPKSHEILHAILREELKLMAQGESHNASQCWA